MCGGELVIENKGKRLARLDALLHALPVDNMPMILSELDGYVIGVLACPEMIPPSEWLPLVWGESGDPHFPNQEVTKSTIDAVIEHYNSLAEAMTRSLLLAPIYEIDPISDETLWEPWVEGFTHAMRLRPSAWKKLLELADKETLASVEFMMALRDIGHGERKFTQDEIDEIDVEAPDMIPKCLATILKQSRPELAETMLANLPVNLHFATARPQ